MKTNTKNKEGKKRQIERERKTEIYMRKVKESQDKNNVKKEEEKEHVQ